MVTAEELAHRHGVEVKCVLTSAPLCWFTEGLSALPHSSTQKIPLKDFLKGIGAAINASRVAVPPAPRLLAHQDAMKPQLGTFLKSWNEVRNLPPPALGTPSPLSSVVAFRPFPASPSLLTGHGETCPLLPLSQPPSVRSKCPGSWIWPMTMVVPAGIPHPAPAHRLVGDT